LTRSHEAKMAQELGQAKVQVDVAHDRVKASEAQAQLLLQEQEQLSAVLISELRKALKAITDQDGANTRASAAMEVLLRKDFVQSLLVWWCSQTQPWKTRLTWTNCSTGITVPGR